MKTHGGTGQPGFTERCGQSPAAEPAECPGRTAAGGAGEKMASSTSGGGLGRRHAPSGIGQWAQGHAGVEVIGGSEADSGGKTELPEEGPLCVTMGAWGGGQVLIKGEEREAGGLECLKNANYCEDDDRGRRSRSGAGRGWENEGRCGAVMTLKWGLRERQESPPYLGTQVGSQPGRGAE